MSIENFLTRTCVQTAVYWGAPVEDGYGGKTFAAPVEIKCRWEERTQTLTDNMGTVIGSRANVYVLQDVDEEGYLFLGSLTDLTTPQKSDPASVDGAWYIKQFEKIPALGSNTVFLRQAYLLVWQRR